MLCFLLNLVIKTIIMRSKVGFGNIFWPSLLAALIVSIIGVIIWLIAVFGIIGSFSSVVESTGVSAPKNAVLHMKLDKPIAERTSAQFNPGSLSFDNQIGLADILEALKMAEKDENIKGLYLELEGLQCNFVTAKEIRKAINRFEKSGKWTLAYNSGEVTTLKEYYISSAASKVYGFPASNFEMLGLASEVAFFKGTLDKLDLELQVIRGRDNDFKSAMEPFFLDKISDSSRLQLNTYIQTIWDDVIGDISKARNISTDKINTIADDMLAVNTEDAVKHNLMDGVKYQDEMMKMITSKLGKKADDKIAMVNFEKYSVKNVKRDLIAKGSNGNIALILAEGGISVDGNEMTSKDICKQVKAARENDNVKIVVLRINSGGGSAIASEQMWREIDLTNKKKKVIVSMGDVAASGGYYMAAPAYKIFAEPTTITGSIGVFGAIPYTADMFKNKLGMSFDYVSTNKHEALSSNRRLTPEEVAMVQDQINDIYETFLSRVAAGRNMTKEQVNVIARGRVWAGKDAKKIGLVDELGGLEEAINYAAKTAGISKGDINVIYYPLRKEDKWEAIAEMIEESQNKAMIKTEKMPALFINALDQWKKVEAMSGIQMRLPYELTIK